MSIFCLNFVFKLKLHQGWCGGCSLGFSSWTGHHVCKVLRSLPEVIGFFSGSSEFSFTKPNTLNSNSICELLQLYPDFYQPYLRSSNTYPVINNCRQTQVIKYLCAVPPYSYGAIFFKTFIIKSINLVTRNVYGQAKKQYKTLYRVVFI